MPKGLFGFPRLTSIGPLVTDGGENTFELGRAGRVVDAEALGAFEDGDFVEIVRLPVEDKDNKIDLEEMHSTGRATVTEKQLRDGVEFP